MVEPDAHRGRASTRKAARRQGRGAARRRDRIGDRALVQPALPLLGSGRSVPERPRANLEVSQVGEAPEAGQRLSLGSGRELLPNSKKPWTLNEDTVFEHPRALCAHQDTASCSPGVEAHLGGLKKWGKC